MAKRFYVVSEYPTDSPIVEGPMGIMPAIRRAPKLQAANSTRHQRARTFITTSPPC